MRTKRVDLRRLAVGVIALPIACRERGVMKILMGIDGSKFSKSLVRSLVSQFRTEDAEVLTLHVLEPVEPVAPPEMSQGYAPELEGQKKPALMLLEGIADQLRRAGFSVKTSVEIGDARETLIERAMTWGADLILVGSHGKRGIQSFVLGSVSESVARHAKCSVEIVRMPVTE
jgi:nucleotide-binding universal stress UspA family protein